MTQETEFLIVGGGIVSLTLARELLQNGADKIHIIEKENSLGMHASGRNSGVLHAGIYYPPNTLKAQLCLKGNLLLQQYCIEKKLPLQHTGKVIVARDASELPILENLHTRALQNGAKVDLIDEKELEKKEPHAKTFHKALYSHYTSVVDNKKILQSLANDLRQSKKVTIQYNTRFLKPLQSNTIQTSQGNIHFKHLISAAGAYADKIAHSFGLGKSYYLIPFKGIYKKLIKEKSYLVNGNIYPVPDLKNPFLGVHFTKNLSGDVYLGPTAIPALGRENYGLMKGIDFEFTKIFFHQAKMFFKNPKFRHIALEEPKKYWSSYFYQDAKKLVKELKPEWVMSSPKVGIRPQLIDIHNNELLMDFLVLKENNTIHILNAISPAFTSSMAFAKYIINHYIK